MPPSINSRYQYCRSWQDQNEVWFLEVPRPYRFTDEDDNVPYEVKTGDNLQVIAYRYYRGYAGAAQLWRAIAEFNDIIDVTLPLKSGRQLIIPSMRWIKEVFLAPTEDYKNILVGLGRVS